jgi:cyclopropane fatty-acyl-phospholipid synthase-like methyltransferase
VRQRSVALEGKSELEGSGLFDVVVSSFADHHIKPTDKGRYFRNVTDNMKPGGLFLVGDEFLPEHDQSDVNAHKAALERYHNHIIEIARNQGKRF